ncbi:aminopeptidase N [Pengzhenrongella frigida]|uniref:Aminopeptidase N n=1 Tax=Pengzhenrongella frigida TaxID=1259133 RepID=A0A4Q5N2G7_9MICO|nr:aminopeptidase N [Cellulomonas sp. HLT2-17]RYV52378.1 aminopeptidase N [Cellulomonas sp. HLT2-17]
MPAENLTRDEAQERAALLSVTSYQVALDLTTGPTTFTSSTVIRFSASEGAATFVDLIAPTVRAVTLNGRELDPAVVFADSRIQLEGLAAQNELRVEAECAYTNTGEGLHRFVDPVDEEVYLYSQFEVADSRRVFAVFEQPDLKSVFTFTVTAPAYWRVISNSPTPVATPAPGTSTDAPSAVWSFAPTAVLSSYVTAIVAGPYTGETGELTSSDGRTIPLGVFCRASLAEHLDTENILDLTRRGFAFYEEKFGRAYPYVKYDQIFVPEFNAGAMENAGAVTFRESYVFRSKVPEAVIERRAITILHELAHMWFGDLVTMRWWNDLWLNESFAEYASALAAAEATQWTGAWTTFSSMEKSWAYRQDQLPSTHPIVAEIRDLADVEVNFDGITYAKGASVLRQLVAWVGEDQFFDGVKAYFAKHAYGNTTLRDLLTELEAASGRDLSQWSGLWLERAGVTLLRPEITTDADGVITSFAVLQEVPAAHPVQRPHRLAIGGYDVVDGDGGARLERTVRVELDVDGARTEVPELVGRRRPDLVLVNDDDLAYAKVRLDPRSLATATAHLGSFPADLPRTLVWAAAWDMTRDGELAGRDFIDLVLGNLAHETNSSVVLVLLRQLSTTLDMFVAEEHRVATSAAAGDRLWTLVEGAAAGSDTELQLVKAFAVRAQTPGQLDAIAALLDGTRVLDGLTIDTDLRWELLTALVAGGRAGEAEITAALVVDATASGEREAAGARAAIPTTEAKAAAWHAMVEDDTLPNALLETSIGGFVDVHDRALLVPYVEAYFASIEQVWATRGNDMAQDIAQGLYPTELAAYPGVDLLTRTDAWLTELGDRQPGLRRMVVENRDAVRRALAAQDTDRARG